MQVMRMTARKDDLDSTRYVGAHDPTEATRLDAQQAGALDELRGALALHPIPTAAPRVLELGCGSGVFTRALLTALPAAALTATDRDLRLLNATRAALTDDIRAGRLTLIHADAAALPFPSQSFDLVACRCLLMHQPDPLVVAAEMYRVLAVGGVALAIEPDWGARALYPDAEALAALLDLARRARPFGFPDLLLGRQLFALLRAAGFVRVRIHPTAFAETADMLPETESDTGMDADLGGITGPGRLLDQARPLLRRASLATDDQIDTLVARLAAARRHPEYFSAGVDFAAAAVKLAPRLPGGTV
jgi:SAM-dependent methyltransferase